MIAGRREALIEPALSIAEAPSHRGARARCRSRPRWRQRSPGPASEPIAATSRSVSRPGSPSANRWLASQKVTQSTRHDSVATGLAGERLDEGERFFDQPPGGGALGPVPGDPLGHFGVARPGGGDENRRAAARLGKMARIAALARARAAKNENAASIGRGLHRALHRDASCRSHRARPHTAASSASGAMLVPLHSDYDSFGVSG